MPRIVSLLPAATEMICGIGLREQLVGVSHECNWPRGLEALPRLTRSRIDSSADSGAIDEQVKRLAASGEALYEVNAELLTALRPTLIVTQAQCDVCAVSLASVEGIVATRPELRETQVLALNPLSLAAVLDDIERIGTAAGSPPTRGRHRMDRAPHGGRQLDARVGRTCWRRLRARRSGAPQSLRRVAADR